MYLQNQLYLTFKYIIIILLKFLIIYLTNVHLFTWRALAVHLGNALIRTHSRYIKQNKLYFFQEQR